MRSDGVDLETWPAVEIGTGSHCWASQHWHRALPEAGIRW